MILTTAIPTTNRRSGVIHLPIRMVRDARLAVWEMKRIERAQAATDDSDEIETAETIARGVRDCAVYDRLARELAAYIGDDAGRRQAVYVGW